MKTQYDAINDVVKRDGEILKYDLVTPDPEK